MSWSVLLLVLLCAVLTAVSNLLFRHSVVHVGEMTPAAAGVIETVWRLIQQPAFIIGFIGYGTAAVVWFRILRLAEVSTSYPILVGLTFILVTLGATLAFRESISVAKIVGISMILVGIVIAARG